MAYQTLMQYQLIRQEVLVFAVFLLSFRILIYEKDYLRQIYDLFFQHLMSIQANCHQ